MSLLYMIIAPEEMQLLQLGALEVICSKQYLEDPEKTITTVPVSFGGSYSTFSEDDLRKLALNSGIELNANTYAEVVGQLRQGIIEKYANQPKLKDLAYYESKLAKRMKEEPELYEQFEPKAVALVTGRTNSSRPTISNTPKSAPVARPAGGTTKKVWDIADVLRAENPSKDAKALRPLIIEQCKAEGINPSTAGTQYAKWNNSQNWEKV